MSMLDEDEEYEDEVLYERRGTPVLRSARPELVVPTPWTSRLWTEVPDSSLWPRACSAKGLRASMMAEPRPPFSGRCLGWLSVGCCCSTQRALSPDPQAREPLSLWTEVWPTQPVLTQPY